MKQLNKIKNIIEQMISQPNSYCDPSVLSYLIDSLNKENELVNLKFTIYDNPLVLNLTAYLQYKNQRTIYNMEDYLETGLDKFSYDYIVKERNQQENVEISKAAMEKLQNQQTDTIRQDKVDEMRKKIANGDFQVNANKIADKLLQQYKTTEAL